MKTMKFDLNILGELKGNRSRHLMTEIYCLLKENAINNLVCMSNSEISFILRVSQLSIFNAINKLKECGLLEKIGQDKQTRKNIYKLNR